MTAKVSICEVFNVLEDRLEEKGLAESYKRQINPLSLEQDFQKADHFRASCIILRQCTGRQNEEYEAYEDVRLRYYEANNRNDVAL